MSAGSVAEVCPNCGALWEPGGGGACPWCHARVEANPLTVHPTGRSVACLGSQNGMVPTGTDDCFTSSPFLYMLLSVLDSGLSPEPAVQEYARVAPGVHLQIRALTAAVSTSGARARDAGLLKSDMDNNLKVYSPEEIWTFDLAVDVIAMLGGLEGLPGSSRATIANDVRQLDREVHSHTWKKELKKAGGGPEAFRELRAEVPRHKVDPVW